MKALIVFHESTDVQPHTTDIDTVPRQGDFFDLPDVSSQGLFPVERVIFRLERPQGDKEIFEVPTEAPAIRIYLGVAIERSS